MVADNYTAESIEVLSGLDPVRKRPGMYTDTTRPNHLAQEVIDNSVDEALAGHATTIEVTVFKDGSCEVKDDGRGMPVDIHPEKGVPGVEVIMATLHAGGKFSNKNYQFSGGLHGVGVSVVNALSKVLEVTIQRDGNIYRMGFRDGDKATELEVIGTCPKRQTGTAIRFLPDPKYFDSPKYSISRLTHLLRAKAVLCPGLHVKFTDENSGEMQEWRYEDGLKDYLQQANQGWTVLPEEPFMGSMQAETEAVDWAVQWLPEGGELVTESYVNLIPTAQGGTHVNGLRTGLLEAMREYCENRNLLPRGVKLTAEDVWDKCTYVLSVKMQDPQPVVAPTHGGRRCPGGSGGEQRPETSARQQESGTEESHCRSRLAGQVGGLFQPGPGAYRTVPGGRGFCRRFRQTGAGPGIPGGDAVARKNSEYLGSGFQ